MERFYGRVLEGRKCTRDKMIENSLSESHQDKEKTTGGWVGQGGAGPVMPKADLQVSVARCASSKLRET